MAYPSSVRVVEVGPRDGLQNEPQSISTSQKANFIEQLVSAGLKTVEAGSFVSAQAVPAMADTSDVLARLSYEANVRYIALVPNLRGFELALGAGAKEIAVFTAASETFAQRNIGCSIAQSLKTFAEICRRATDSSIRVRGYISCVAGCPYEGTIRAETVRGVASELLAMGCYEVSLGDTIGSGTPGQIERLLAEVMAGIPAAKLAVHFHDTWGAALANILVALQAGISVVDSSVAGLGGCPYAPGAAGNVATEDLLHMLHGMKIETGVDIQKVAEAGAEVCKMLKRPTASKAALALAADQRR